MFGTNSVEGSFNIDQYTPKRVASAYTNNLRAQGIQQFARPSDKPFQGKGIQAGSAGSNYMKAMEQAQGLASMRNAASEAGRGIYEKNRDAQLKAQGAQAGEFNRMGAAASDMDQSDWSERYMQDAVTQNMAEAQRRYAVQGQRAASNLAMPFVAGLTGGKALGGILSGLFR